MNPPLLPIVTGYRFWKKGTQSIVMNQQVIAGHLRNQELEGLGASGNMGRSEQTKKAGNVRAGCDEPRVLSGGAVLGPSLAETSAAGPGGRGSCRESKHTGPTPALTYSSRAPLNKFSSSEPQCS